MELPDYYTRILVALSALGNLFAAMYLLYLKRRVVHVASTLAAAICRLGLEAFAPAPEFQLARKPDWARCENKRVIVLTHSGPEGSEFAEWVVQALSQR